ncbi:hypothetical protein Tco_0291347 [Tanacetum coccineum]
MVLGQDNAQDALLIDVDSNAPVRSTSALEFVRHENGLVEIKFSSSQPNYLDEAAKINDDEDLLKKRKSSQQKLKKRYEKEPSQPPSPPHKTSPSPHKPPPISPPPPKLSPYNQKALSILHQDSPVFPITKDPSCSYSQEYEQEFPALTAFEHLDSRTKHDWKIKNPTTIGPTGHANTISPAEATLNWQSENAVAQNKVLVKILSQQGVSFDPQLLPQSYTHTTSPLLNIWALEQRRLKPSTRKEPTFSQDSQYIADIVASTKTPDVLPIQKFDAEDYKEHQENPNQETPTEFLKSDIKQYFTFDDVPPSKWRERSIKMLTWCTTEVQYYTIDVVIRRFLTRLQGRLRDWYYSLGEYRQLQIQQSISPEAFMSIIYSEFIGSP